MNNQRQVKNLVLFISIIASLFYSLFSLASQPATCSSKEYRQFDFWLGDWEVRDSKNQVVGHNKIFPILKGCAISENWTSVSGNPGVSYNFYDQAEKKWHQTWVDQSGGVLYLDGNIKDGKMILSGKRPDKEGNKVLHRITWSLLADGRVKQHWQISNSNDSQWNDLFVGFYKKK